MIIQKRSAFLVLVWFTLLSASSRQTDPRTQYFPRLEQKPTRIPGRQKVWVFLLAGQSNMAGRGIVEPQDTVPDSRILTINKAGEIILAKEPLHFYEPDLTGLDCGLSFARTLLSSVPDDVSVLLLPTAVGGSSISQWLGDSLHRDVHLMSNFKDKVAMGKRYGQIKGVLWHQGESDAHAQTIPKYKDRLATLFSTFREVAGDDNLVIVAGALGSYSENPDNWKKINDQIRAYTAKDSRSGLVTTADLVHKGDNIHFNSEGQRKLGERFAKAYLTASRRQ